MNKENAAKYLQIGVRSLERYTSKGQIKPSRNKVKTGWALDYSTDELDRFRREVLDAPPVVNGEVGDPGGDAGGTAGGDPMANVAAIVDGPPSNALARLPHATSTAIVEARPQRARATVGIEHKLLLSLDEAQALTGLSRGVLRQAIADKKLNAAQIGRGFKMRRSDLETYIKKLF
jgi:excisionase family DNA binding protein